MFLISFAASCIQQLAGEAVSLIDSAVILARKILAVDFMVVSGVLAEINRWAGALLDFLIAVGVGFNHTIHDFAAFVLDLVDIVVCCLLFAEAVVMQLTSIVFAVYSTIASGVIGILTLLRTCVIEVSFLLATAVFYLQYFAGLLGRAMDMVFRLLVAGFALIPSAIKSMLLTPFVILDSCGRYAFVFTLKMAKAMVRSVTGSVRAVPIDAYVGLMLVMLVTYLCRRHSAHRLLFRLLDHQARRLTARLRPLCVGTWRRLMETSAAVAAVVAGAWTRLCQVVTATVDHVCWILIDVFNRMNVIGLIIIRLWIVASYVRRLRQFVWQQLLRVVPASTPAPVNRQSETETSSDEDDPVVVAPRAAAGKAHCSGQDSSQETVRELRQRLARAQENALCIVCQDVEKSVVILPCRHFCMCRDCSYRVLTHDGVCPICRHDIDNLMQIYS